MSTLDQVEDRQQLMRWCCGNELAVNLIMGWFAIFHMWDDLVDGDKPLAVDDVMFEAMVRCPNNPFFLQHREMLSGQLMTAIFEWHTANELERGNEHDQTIAYTLRCNVLGLVQLCALLTGGPDHARQVGVEIRRYGQRETLTEYLEELACRTSSEA